MYDVYIYIYFLLCVSSNESSRLSGLQVVARRVSRGYRDSTRERARFNGTARCHIDRARWSRKRRESPGACVARRHARNTHPSRTDGTDGTETEREKERGRERERQRERGRKRDGERRRERASERERGALGREIENDSGVYCIIPRWSTRESRARQVHALFWVQSTRWKAEEVVQRSLTVAHYYPTLFYWLHTPKIETGVLMHHGLNSPSLNTTGNHRHLRSTRSSRSLNGG